MTHILSHEPRAEPGVTSDLHIENVIIKDTGNWILKNLLCYTIAICLVFLKLFIYINYVVW